jgi:pimeloyl-ACP methyl ester carboxylesterase
MDAPDAQAVDVGGLELAYRRAGSGPVLVLLHGAYEDSRIWEHQFEDLSDEFTVIAWDAPGCGGSDDLPEGYAGSYGAVLAGFLGALGLTEGSRRPHVLGLSFGSTVAMDLWKVRPEIPATLILASAYAGWAGSLPPEEVERRYRQVLAELDQPAEKIVRAWLPTLFTERATPEATGLAARVMADFRAPGMRTMLELAGRADYRPVLPTITVPTLLLYGAEDVRSPVAVGEALRAQIPGARLEVLPGAGHMSFLEAPEAFDGAVRRWLEGHPGR